MIASLALVVLAAAPQHRVDLQQRLDQVKVESTVNGLRVRVDDRLLSPDDYVRELYDTKLAMEHASWIYKVMNITSPWGILWVSVGFLGQALFTFRMVLQWLVSEKHKKSVVPVGFWWGSLFGGLMLLLYFCWRKDIVGIVGQSTGAFIYARNLVLIYRGRRAPSVAEDPEPEPELGR